MLRKILLAFLSIFSILNTYSQKVRLDFSEKDSIHSVYIDSYKEKLTLFAYGITKSSNFEFIDDEQNKSIMYDPNENLNFGLGFNYKWMGFSAAFNFGAVNNDDDIYGKTKHPLTLQLDIFPKGWLLNVSLQTYKGYYWSNPEDFNDYFDPKWNANDSLEIRPDMVTVSFGLSGFYAFNKNKFSYLAAYANTEQQKKSAGSFLLGGSFSLYGILADNPILPYHLKDVYPNSYAINEITSSLLGVLAGYSYTLVIKKHFYANAALLLGLNYQKVSIHNLNDTQVDILHKASTNSVARFSMGYSKPRYYFGINASTANYLLQSNDQVSFMHSDSKFRFFYGRRFDVSRRQRNKN